MPSQGFTLWFTGLSGAGKSTLAEACVEELRRRGETKIEVLDGDVIRTNLSKGLGFSKEDRDTNIRRIGFVCELLTRNGVIAIAAAIAPYRSVREENRKRIGRYVEVFCDCPIEVLAQRDVKGLYRKALAGEIPNFTGVSDPYEAPEHPDVHIHSDRDSIAEDVQKIMRKLEELGYLDAAPAACCCCARSAAATAI
ncbi:MAG: putative bifunctional SAT/APS kinase [candidate division BRC1 bacterium ADurb.BinA364]|nr:MAG: putative bifunctional SAT/APS kinase [candidate division BRC1 bacterium ADurb.BinA364]